MKIIFTAFALFVSVSNFANAQPSLTLENLSVRLDQLETKTNILEAQLNAKSNNCELIYQHLGARLNRCPVGSFVMGIVDVGGNSLQLECGKYQLQCH